VDPRLSPLASVEIGASAPPPLSRRRPTGLLDRPERGCLPDLPVTGAVRAPNQHLCASTAASETVYRTGPTGPSVMIWNHDFYVIESSAHLIF
jgi:hypothetical protein